jgi:hypothetical protein
MENTKQKLKNKASTMKNVLVSAVPKMSMNQEQNNSEIKRNDQSQSGGSVPKKRKNMKMKMKMKTVKCYENGE